MRRRLIIGSLCLLGCAGIAGLAATARGSSDPHKLRAYGLLPSTLGHTMPAVSHPPGSRTLRVNGRDFVATSIDNPPSGLSQGDQIVVNGKLFFRHQPVGALEAQEVLTNTAPGRLMISFTLLLKRGQISGTAIAKLRNGPIRLAITGGTGAYRRISGDGAAISSGSTTRFTLVYWTS
ncbi:MAG TPA: hypothetical protein VFQ71_07360 [Gaiellales bacterium]|nr:hypothetical protein [Gaiellales bacterium]